MTVLSFLPHHNSIREKNLYEREIFILIFQSLKVFACTQSLCKKLSFQYHISGRMVLRKAKKCRRKLFILFQYKRDNFFAAVVITRVNRGNVFFHIIEPKILHRLALMVVEKWSEEETDKQWNVVGTSWDVEVERKVSPNNWLCISLLILLPLLLCHQKWKLFFFGRKTKCIVSVIWVLVL